MALAGGGNGRSWPRTATKDSEPASGGGMAGGSAPLSAERPLLHRREGGLGVVPPSPLPIPTTSHPAILLFSLLPVLLLALFSPVLSLLRRDLPEVWKWEPPMGVNGVTTL